METVALLVVLLRHTQKVTESVEIAMTSAIPATIIPQIVLNAQKNTLTL